MLTALALQLVLATAPAAPAAWPAPWASRLQAHFDAKQPVQAPLELVDEVLDKWTREKPTTLDAMLDPLWQGEQVYLLDAEALARVHARVQLHSIFPLAGTDAGGRSFAMRAALLGRKRFAFIYDNDLVVGIPSYRVLDRDRFTLGALNLGRLEHGGATHLRGVSAAGRELPIEGPFGANIEGFVKEGDRIRVKLRMLPDRLIHPRRVTIVDERQALR
ncbi:MAG: hypothetical protein ACK4N5_05290 [Myxococcales bacterium]